MGDSHQDVVISYQGQDTFTFKVLLSLFSNRVCILGPKMFSERQVSGVTLTTARARLSSSPACRFRPRGA